MKSNSKLTASALLYIVIIGSAYAVNSLGRDATLTIENAKIGMAQAVTTAERYVGGKAIHAEFERHKQKSTFDIEVVKDKIIMKVKIDPMSGEVLSSIEDKNIKSNKFK
jgi:uncharacterized membrane protein YkoI